MGKILGRDIVERRGLYTGHLAEVCRIKIEQIDRLYPVAEEIVRPLKLREKLPIKAEYCF